MTIRIEVFQEEGASGDWRWHKQTDNNRMVSGSMEAFDDKDYAIESAQKYGGDYDELVIMHPDGTEEVIGSEHEADNGEA